MFLCDRDKRDVHYSDDPTEEEIQIFKQTPLLQPRFRRASQVGQISKENATSYCAERISETEIGKLCAKVGVNVQALVNTCSADVEVSKQQKIIWAINFDNGMNEMAFLRYTSYLQQLLICILIIGTLF